MSDDVRISDWSLTASAGMTASLQFTSPTALASLAVYVGGTTDDVDDLTGATAYAGTLSGGNLVASVDLAVPDAGGTIPLRLVVNGAVQSVGHLRPSAKGTPAPDNTITLTAGVYEFDLTILGIVQAAGGVSDGDKGDITVSASGSTWTIDSSGMAAIAAHSTIVEKIQDVVGTMATAGSNIALTYDDTAGTLTIAVTGLTNYTDEQARDALGTALVAGNNIDITVSDVGDTITIDVEGLTSADISDFATAVDERARDAIGAALVAGAGLTITPSDVGDTITIAFTADMATQAELDAAVADLIAGDGSIETIIAVTRAEYDAIPVPDPTTYYIITDEVGEAVLESAFDANTILKADTDDTPTALTVAEQRLVGRITAGVITALTAAQVRTLLNVEDGATNDQTAAEILTKLLTVDGSGSGLDADLLDGLSSAAFATAAQGATADAAIAKATADANSVLYAVSDNTPAALAMGASTILARLAAGNIVAATPAELRTLLDVSWRMVDEDTVVYTGGDITLDQTAITNLTATQITLQGAQAGDVVKVNVSALLSNANQLVTFDAYTYVGGTRTNPFGAGLSASAGSLAGFMGWFVPATGAVFYSLGGGRARRALVSGDISGGNVTIGLAYAKTTATARTLFANANDPIQVTAELWRP